MESITVIIKTSKGMKEYTYEGNLNIPVTTLLERINVKHVQLPSRTVRKLFNDNKWFAKACMQNICE
ncbi:hypothetical protein [uncultured Methanobrevibacter sp.]|uniref:hypothetical protein n=1 Tax=uncultured Methanobrevibacter sp. TaxID=253161 RepID=UPI0025ECA158|nr:hypothetical protein [uncultured Methanobrevibacter sp.]